MYPSKYIVDEQSRYYGRVRNRANNVCFDHLQKDEAHHGVSYHLGQYPCHDKLGDSQYYTFSFESELRNEYMCAESGKAGGLTTAVNMITCHGMGGNQLWDRLEWGGLRHRSSQLCLGSPNKNAGVELVMEACDEARESQKWDFEFENKEPP